VIVPTTRFFSSMLSSPSLYSSIPWNSFSLRVMLTGMPICDAVLCFRAQAKRHKVKVSSVTDLCIVFICVCIYARQHLTWITFEFFKPFSVTPKLLFKRVYGLILTLLAFHEILHQRNQKSRDFQKRRRKKIVFVSKNIKSLSQYSIHFPFSMTLFAAL